MLSPQTAHHPAHINTINWHLTSHYTFLEPSSNAPWSSWWHTLLTLSLREKEAQTGTWECHRHKWNMFMHLEILHIINLYWSHCLWYLSHSENKHMKHITHKEAIALCVSCQLREIENSVGGCAGNTTHSSTFSHESTAALFPWLIFALGVLMLNFLPRSIRAH